MNSVNGDRNIGLWIGDHNFMNSLLLFEHFKISVQKEDGTEVEDQVVSFKNCTELATMNGSAAVESFVLVNE